MEDQLPLTDVLRRAITDSGLSFQALEKETGVLRQSLMLFVRGEQSLRLDVADRLAAYFGYTLKGGKMPSTHQAATPVRKRNPRQEYGTFFHPLVTELQQRGFTAPKTGKSWNYCTFASEREGVLYGVAFRHRGQVSAYVRFAFKNAAKNKRSADALGADRDQIEKEFGAALVWGEERHNKHSDRRIAIYRQGNIKDDATTLDEIRRWAIDQLCKLKTVLGPRLAKLP